MISVVIPAFNAASTIGAQLEALAPQCARVASEVIVADNGSTDDTCQVVEKWADEMPVRIVDASARRGAAAARNIGVGSATGELLAFTDADDVASPGWLNAYASVTDEVGLAGGPVLYFRAGETPPSSGDVAGVPPIQLGFLPYTVGANLLLRRECFEAVGGFPERWPPAEDVVICWQLQLEGVALHYVADAVIWKRRRPTMRAALREYYGYGRRDPELVREFQRYGVHAPSISGALRAYAGILGRLPLLPFSEGARERWSSQAGRRSGRVVGSVRTRTLCL